MRNIYLEDPERFWPRLRDLRSEALFVWGRQDRIVPIGFARHVREALPAARHLELDCGHVPQLEAPRETHAAIAELLRAGRPGARRAPAGGRAELARPSSARCLGELRLGREARVPARPAGTWVWREIHSEMNNSPHPR